MPDFKCTMLFNTHTDPSARAGGWSETFYGTFTGITDAIAGISALAGRRSYLIPKQAVCVGVRASQVDNAAVSRQQLESIAGLTVNETDTFFQSLLINLRTASGAHRPYLIRSIPDYAITTGEFTPSPTFRGYVTAYMNVLTNGTWKLKARNRANPIIRVIGVTPTDPPTFRQEGELVLGTPVTWGLGAVIRFFRTNSITRQPITGTFRVTVAGAGTPTSPIRISPWPTALVVRSGGVRLATSAYEAINETDWNTSTAQRNRIVEKKVGRPFFLMRGRRSRVNPLVGIPG